MDIFLWAATHAGTAVAILFILNLCFVGVVLLLENREPEKSIGWLLALIAFPIIGFILYLFFGHNWHKQTYQDRRLVHYAMNERKRMAEEDAEQVPDPQAAAFHYFATNASGFRLTKGNAVRILTDAHEKYARMFAELRKAKTSIDVEYFIFRYDRTGIEMINILKQKAKEGVRVRFLVDGMGSLGFGRKAFPDMRAAGIQAHYFAPLITIFFFFKANYRDHRKIVVIDNEIVYTGGINIGNEYLGESRKGFWRDTSLELRGPCVRQFAELFQEAWGRTVGSSAKPDLPRPKHQPEQETVSVIPSGPDTDWLAIHQLYLAMIHGAKTRIRIQTPYFIPDESIHAALLNAALRGVDVQIMLPRNPDYAYLRWVANTYLEEILRAGGRVFEYVNGFLHPKVILVDDRIATIGTCNIDIRSFRLDFEVNILTSGSKTVRHLLEDFEHDLGNCEEIDYLEFIDRPLGKRMKESVARLIAPLL